MKRYCPFPLKTQVLVSYSVDFFVTDLPRGDRRDLLQGGPSGAVGARLEENIRTDRNVRRSPWSRSGR